MAQIKEDGIMPLALADIGVRYTIQRIVGSHDMIHHLEDMGFVIGGTVELISEVNGNFIVAVKGARIGLGREYLKRIIVA